MKYFSDKEVDCQTSEILQGYLREMCGKGILFAFYQNYPKQWLKEVQLYDKYIVEYHANEGNKVRIIYQIEGGEVCSETLSPTYADTYIKEFTLYSGEVLYYQFKEDSEDGMIVSSKYSYEQKKATTFEGKYGRLNWISELKKEEQSKAMIQFKCEEELAKNLFPTY